MISPVPLAKWQHLVAALSGPMPDQVALDRPWRQDSETITWFSRGAWALQAVARARRDNGRDVVVWIPNYFCNQSSEPLRAIGAKLVFYPVTWTLHPHWEACHALAVNAAPDLFVLVHHFGRPGPTALARRFCDSQGAWMVEDAAHVLAPGPGGGEPIGQYADFVFYSPHKLLPVPDGAILLSRQPEARIETPTARSPLPIAWLIKAAARKVLPGLRRPPLPFYADPAPLTPVSPSSPAPAPSVVALRLLARMVEHIEDVARRRRDNAKVLARAMAHLPGCQPLFDDNSHVPYRFVVRCEQAEAIHTDLLSGGCPVESWPDLAPEVLAQPRRHEVAMALRRSVLLLPVHQSIDAKRLLAHCAPY